MTQHELDHAVSTATGEELDLIQGRGFSLADPWKVDFDPEPTAFPQMVDWDEQELERNVALFARPQDVSLALAEAG